MNKKQIVFASLLSLIVSASWAANNSHIADGVAATSSVGDSNNTAKSTVKSPAKSQGITNTKENAGAKKNADANKKSESAKSAAKAKTYSAKHHSDNRINKNATRQSQVKAVIDKQALTENDKSSVKTDKRKRLIADKSVRSKSPALSQKSHEFEIYDANSYLIHDIDGDGYFSEFEIEFDADTVYSWAEVYAVLYISRNGGPWEEYYTTDVFEIHGSNADEYSVTTVLNFDYPTGDYDILIDLYEYGYSGIVATLSSEHDIDLSYLPLEDRDHETNYQSGFWFYDITTDLITDYDNDGFYSEFALSFDVDTDYASADVYAEIFFLNEQGQWELEYSSSDITLQGNSTTDTQHLEFDWQSGYPTGYYDFKIVIRDSYSNEQLVETYSEFYALNEVPLESADRDNSYNSGNSGGSHSGGGSSTSYESGGSLSVLIALLAVFGVSRRKWLS